MNNGDVLLWQKYYSDRNKENHEVKSILNAYGKLYNSLATKVLKPRFQKLEN